MKKQFISAHSSVFFLFMAILFEIVFIFFAISAQAAEKRQIIFPVIGSVRYSDDFGDPRSGGRTHEGNDIVGKKMIPLVAVVDGTVRFVAYPEPYYGYMVSIEDEDGYQYRYLHINNDKPGTDDNKGGGVNAYALDMKRGYPVAAGQLIGWMGDSGNAESTAPHLHFEIRSSDGAPINPYQSLKAARKMLKPVDAPAMPGEILPFGKFKGGASIARGDVRPNTDGEEIIAGAGAGGGPQVRVYSRDGILLSQFFAYDQEFRGGLDITTGDINGDGVDEVITAAGAGTIGPLVRVFDYWGNQLLQFFAYSENFLGGAKVAAADLYGDGTDEIITGAGPGGGPHVRIWNNSGERIAQFFAYSENFRGGIDVAAVDATSDTSSAVITAPGAGGGPQVRIFSQYGIPVGQFFAYDSKSRGGVRIDSVNLFSEDGISRPVVVTSFASNGSPYFRAYSLNGDLTGRFSQFEKWWVGGYDISIGSDGLIVVSSIGGRRTSIRYAEQESLE